MHHLEQFEKIARLEIAKHKNSNICAVSACKEYLALRNQKSGP
jgi:hypothetical protein